MLTPAFISVFFLLCLKYLLSIFYRAECEHSPRNCLPVKFSAEMKNQTLNLHKLSTEYFSPPKWKTKLSSYAKLSKRKIFSADLKNETVKLRKDSPPSILLSPTPTPNCQTKKSPPPSDFLCQNGKLNCQVTPNSQM